jgi:hypothetical protein
MPRGFTPGAIAMWESRRCGLVWQNDLKGSRMYIMEMTVTGSVVISVSKCPDLTSPSTGIKIFFSD